MQWGYFEVGMYNGQRKDREDVLHDFKLGRFDVGEHANTSVKSYFPSHPNMKTIVQSSPALISRAEISMYWTTYHGAASSSTKSTG